MTNDERRMEIIQERCDGSEYKARELKWAEGYYVESAGKSKLEIEPGHPSWTCEDGCCDELAKEWKIDLQRAAHYTSDVKFLLGKLRRVEETVDSFVSDMKAI